MLKTNQEILRKEIYSNGKKELSKNFLSTVPANCFSFLWWNCPHKPTNLSYFKWILSSSKCCFRAHSVMSNSLRPDGL